MGRTESVSLAAQGGEGRAGPARPATLWAEWVRARSSGGTMTGRPADGCPLWYRLQGGRERLICNGFGGGGGVSGALFGHGRASGNFKAVNGPPGACYQADIITLVIVNRGTKTSSMHK